MKWSIQTDLDGNRLIVMPMFTGEDGRTFGRIIRVPLEGLEWAKPKIE